MTQGILASMALGSRFRHQIDDRYTLLGNYWERENNGHPGTYLASSLEAWVDIHDGKLPGEVEAVIPSNRADFFQRYQRMGRLVAVESERKFPEGDPCSRIPEQYRFFEVYRKK
ncbi:hypothetical protein COV20_00725 [Candidatus Woesearchaeota archaeon CG10_big_fil_rev_8_21_14_0_10_45_16]|nr:MAG: hypothetical protein COV20_00725 [Candidatus Woesearchaeota archaeon CG10_big_fil_rev_8_21_14_0_10_45_16]